MKRDSSSSRDAWLDTALYGFSTYAVPLILVLLSALSLAYWPDHYAAPGARELSFRALPEIAQESLSPRQAEQRLRDRAPIGHLDSRLAVTPFWIALPIGDPDPAQPFAQLPAEPSSQSASTGVLEFPSRHATGLICWNAATFEELGRATRKTTTGALVAAKAGYIIELARIGPVPELLCRVQFIGPARMTVLRWPAAGFTTSSHAFHRNAGLLEGGLTVLALFVLMTALINRNRVYLLFAAWLIVNLRMGALSAGWDFQWFGGSLPVDWLSRSRLVTLGLYYTLTFTLFRTLFRDDLEQIGHPGLLGFAQWTCVPVLVGCVLLSYESFLPCLWVITGLSIALVGFLLARILSRVRSRVAMWYTASLIVTLFASLYEVLSAALGLRGMIGAVNSVTAALSSSLLASLAIAEQMRIEHRQRLQAQAKLEQTYEAMPIGLFTLDMDGRFTSANPALRQMLGQDVLASGRDSWQQYFEDGSWAQLHDLLRAWSSGELEIRGNPSSGRIDPGRYLVKAALAHDRIEGSLQDVTEKARATEELQFMADNDSLTKVLNRRGIEKVLEAVLRSRATAAGNPASEKLLALAYLDLDRFKLINDLFGHDAGDEVLRQVCARVTSRLPAGVVMGRIGGDEFLIVMPDTRIPQAKTYCQRILAAIGDTPYRVADKAFHVRGSIGLIEVAPGPHVKDAVSTADRACREAKAGHSDGLVIYEKSASAFLEHEAEMRLVEHLSGSTATDGLFLVMQPIMSLAAPHASLDFEALLRMRDANGRLVSAASLIAAAENSGRMSMIDRWVLSTALAWLRQHAAQLRNTRFVCLNLSGASLNDEQFLQDVDAMLASDTGLASLLCFEITESVALRDLENTRRFIDQVRGYGARVALDDFGAGYTSFSYLKDLPADLLKIDGSFIVNMNQHAANVAIVEAIVNLGHQLGMRIVAEWAEDLETVRRLTELGVDYIQGHAIARPQTPQAVLAAPSSASFIEDPEIARYVRRLGGRAPEGRQSPADDPPLQAGRPATQPASLPATRMDRTDLVS